MNALVGANAKTFYTDWATPGMYDTVTQELQKVIDGAICSRFYGRNGSRKCELNLILRSMSTKIFITSKQYRLFRISIYLPAFIFYIIFVIFPLADTFYNSFTQWNGISEKKWVGFDQYINNLQNKKITSSIKHSFILIIFYSVLPIIIGLLIAGIMIRVKINGMATYRAILFLPQILSMIVVGIAWRWIYAPKGPLNSGLILV